MRPIDRQSEKWLASMQLKSHGKHAFRRLPPSLIMSASTPSMSGLLPRLKRWMQADSSHQSPKSFKLLSQLNRTGVLSGFLNTFQKSPLAAMSHSSSLRWHVHCSFIYQSKNQKSFQPPVFVLQCYTDLCTQLPVFKVLLCICCQSKAAACMNTHEVCCEAVALCHASQKASWLLFVQSMSSSSRVSGTKVCCSSQFRDI